MGSEFQHNYYLDRPEQVQFNTYFNYVYDYWQLGNSATILIKAQESEKLDEEKIEKEEAW